MTKLEKIDEAIRDELVRACSIHGGSCNGTPEGRLAVNAAIDHRGIARAVVTELLNPGEAWDGLPRQIMMWMDFGERTTPRSLFTHLERSGYEIPQWLRDEPEMQHLDHVPSKGTRCVLIWKATLANILKEGEG